MQPWMGWTWSTTAAGRRSRLTWQDWQEKQRLLVATQQASETFTDREEARLRFLRWCYVEQRLAS